MRFWQSGVDADGKIVYDTTVIITYEGEQIMPPRKHTRAKQRKQKKILAVIAFISVIAVALAGWGLVTGVGTLINYFTANGSQLNTTPTATRSTVANSPDILNDPEAPAIVATATVGSSGDVLMHNGVRQAGYNSVRGVFDYTESFQFLTPYVQKADYAVVNAEFSVSANSTYSALPFRVPTAVVKSLKDCGYDLGLTANNHIADGGVTGMKKTMDTLTEYGMEFTGTRYNSSDARYLVKDINGIKIGMVNYTYGSYWNTNGFSNDNLSAFYTDAESLINSMRSDGAELVYLYIHWGEEYSIVPNATQEAIAQKMCDLGVDVIIGGHPHKIQPLELINSTDGKHQTVCLYSMGNLLSGQQIECMAGGTKANSPSCYQDSWHHAGCDYPDVADRTQDQHRLEHGTNCNDNGHTEDGVLFNVTASKFDDGTVMITSVDVLPVWCMGRGLKRASYPTNSTFEKYILVPLEQGKDWASSYSLTEAEETEAQYSYDRTMALVGDGIEEINAACKAKVEEYAKTYKQNK